jgi:SPP1 family predicted phage head-tail adaptor
MLWNKIAYLGNEATTQNSLGDDIPVEPSRKVFVNKKSVRQSEFYDAKRSDLKAELMLEVHSVDYEDEDLIKFEGVVYDILRTYDRPDEVTELIVGRNP